MSWRDELLEEAFSQLPSSLNNEDKLDFAVRNNILRIETVMLDFLEGISDKYGGEFMLKGCLCLNNYLRSGVSRRMTSDIDLTMYSKSSWERFVIDACELATTNSILGFKYTLVKRRGFSKNPLSDSLNIAVRYRDKICYTFKLDMNIKTNERLLEVDAKIGSSRLRVYSVYGILSDKINVLCSIKCCRRIKDLIDVYIISKNFNIELKEIIDVLSIRFPEIENIDEYYVCNENNINNIEHAFNKYKNNGIKFSFSEVYSGVLKFISMILVVISDKTVPVQDLEWSCKDEEWLFR